MNGTRKLLPVGNAVSSLVRSNARADWIAGLRLKKPLDLAAATGTAEAGEDPD